MKSSPVGFKQFVTIKKRRETFDFPDHTHLEIESFDPKTQKYYIIIDGNFSAWKTLEEINETFDCSSYTW